MEKKTTVNTESVTVSPAVKYSLTELKAVARKLFGCAPEVLDGAIYGKKQNTFTVEEMRTLITVFLNKPIE